jgi:hypothetical protein
MIEIILALFLFFRQAAKYLGSDYESSAFFAGNLDLFFILGGIGLFFVLNKKPFLRWVVALFLIGCMQFFAITEIVNGSWFLYFAKLILCLSVLFFAREKFAKLRLSWIAVPFSFLVGLWTAIAVLIGPNGLFWTVDDEVNKFDATRLMLTYIEPSELGFSIVIILLVLLYLFFKAKLGWLRLLYAVCLFINIFALYLAKPFGAIGIGLVAIVAMVLFQLLCVRPTLHKQVGALFLIIVSMVSLVVLFSPNGVLQNSSNTIVQRGLSAASGDDDSVNYRVGLSMAVTADSLAASPLIGQGFGTLGSEAFIDKYYDQGLRTSLANSFLAFIAEAGAIGVAILTYLIYRLYRAAFRTKSYLLFGIVTFIVVYQFTGGYFSNPLVWAIYGAVLALEDAHRRKRTTQKVSAA